MNIRNDAGQIRVSVKWLAGLVTALGTILGAAFTIDARYAHAGDVSAAIQAQRNATSYAVDQLRKQNLEDKIFELMLIPEQKRTDAQRAMLDRYRTQALEVDRRWTRPPPTTLPGPQ